VGSLGFVFPVMAHEVAWFVVLGPRRPAPSPPNAPRPSMVRFRPLLFTGTAFGNKAIPEILESKRVAASNCFISRAGGPESSVTIPARPGRRQHGLRTARGAQRPAPARTQAKPGAVSFVTVHCAGTREQSHSRNTESDKRYSILGFHSARRRRVQRSRVRLRVRWTRLPRAGLAAAGGGAGCGTKPLRKS
jgi:hypothetical protein